MSFAVWGEHEAWPLMKGTRKRSSEAKMRELQISALSIWQPPDAPSQQVYMKRPESRWEDQGVDTAHPLTGCRDLANSMTSQGLGFFLLYKSLAGWGLKAFRPKTGLESITAMVQSTLHSYTAENLLRRIPLSQSYSIMQNKIKQKKVPSLYGIIGRMEDSL